MIQTQNNSSLQNMTQQTGGRAADLLNWSLQRRSMEKDRMMNSLLTLFADMRQRREQERAAKHARHQKAEQMGIAAGGALLGAGVGGLAAGGVAGGLTAGQGAMMGAGLGMGGASAISSGQPQQFAPQLVNAGQFMYGIGQQQQQQDQMMKFFNAMYGGNAGMAAGGGNAGMAAGGGNPYAYPSTSMAPYLNP